MRIQQLPVMLANQIAAGEVIERPASVVKELLENSLDAGATHINIDIGYGGLNHIRISDNGLGIFAEDLPLAIAPHATSKISTLEDLYSIESMGFRGEALASIASVAKLTITSKPEHQQDAVMMQVLEGKIQTSPCARAVGTTIEVNDLFFNAPVRKGFLKNQRLEFQALEIVVKRFALSAPHIAINLKHNNKLVLTLPEALSSSAHEARMAKIFGGAFMRDALFIDVEQGGMRLHGWLSGPSMQRSQSDRLWVYVNQRMVKDKLINHALKQSYESLMHPGRFPACLLYFTMDTKTIDVNVHPTKHELRFQQPRLVHDFFTTYVTQALESISEKAPLPMQQDYSESILRPKLDGLIVPRADKLAPLELKVLNSEYALAFIRQIPCLVDLNKLYRAYLEAHIKNSTLGLKSRPLLIPMSYHLKAEQSHKITEELKTNLKQLGIQLVYSEHMLIISGLPIIAPYLDLALFLERLLDASDRSAKNVSSIFCLAQIFDAQQLSTEELWELSQLLYLIENEALELYKPISIERCRMLWHV